MSVAAEPRSTSTSFAAEAARLPTVGVGVTFSAALMPSILRNHDLIDAIEVEPQVNWIEQRHRPTRYRTQPEVEAAIEALPFAKLVHSIGLPVGGHAEHDADQVALLQDTIRRYGAAWFSEHLSFNHTPDGFAGFFLPPHQSDQGIERCVESIRSLRNAVGRPLAVETGVNYLRPRPGEIDDGAFVAAVAEQADCGVLLDLHNVFTNARNGRQSLQDFVGQLDLDRVIEVHVAGGREMDGFWLDAHSGALPSELIGPATDIIASLPNLRAIVFEVYPAFADGDDDKVGDDALRPILEQVRELWESRQTEPAASPPAEPRFRSQLTPVHQSEAADYEVELAGLVTARSVATDPELAGDRGLADDPGVALLRKLSLEFRSAMLVRNLPRTIRFLMMSLGPDIVDGFLDEYRRRRPPAQFGATEALNFVDFLLDLGIGLPQFDGVVRFEAAALRTRLDGRTRILCFDYDPMPMLRALAERRFPDAPSPGGDYEIEITGDESAEPEIIVIDGLARMLESAG